MIRDGTERVHDGGPEARDRRRRERADAEDRRREPEPDAQERGSVRQFIDRLTGHGEADR